MSIYEHLYDWQKRIVDKFKNRLHYGLFLDMGLGKTPIGLAMAEANNCTKILVITINSKAIEDETVSGSWLWWSTKAQLNYITKNKKATEFDTNSNEIFIVNYESLFVKNKGVEARQMKKLSVQLKDNIEAFIKSCKGHEVAILVDESHKVKNSSSLQTKAINSIKRELSLTARKIHMYLLTGTPFTHGYEDLYSQLKLLGYDETKTSFIDQFCKRGHIKGLLEWQQPIVGYKNLDELYRTIHQYALTIKSEDVVNLPDKIFIDHSSAQSEWFDLFTNERMNSKYLSKKLIGVDTDLALQYSKCNKQVNNPFYRNMAYPSEKWMAETVGTFWLRCRQLSIGFQGNAEEAIWYDRTRLNQLKSFLEDNPDNYVLFYNYTPELMEIFDICDQLKYNIDVYCGDIKSMTFYEKYSNQSPEEQTTNKKNIILANFASGATGMNWQQYNKCILFSTPLYDDYEQGLKRVHRLGQKDTVVYHIFYQKNWLDEGMRKSLDQKSNYNSDMFESDLRRIKSIYFKNTDKGEQL